VNIIQSLYLRLSRNEFIKSFKPIGYEKNANYLVSVPRNAKDFIKSLSFLAGLKKTGRVVLLLPKTFGDLIDLFKSDLFETIYYENAPTIFSQEFKILKNLLKKRNFNSLIELNVPANISLPYLVDVKRRISFYDEKIFPYYNILVKGDASAMNDFFQFRKMNPQILFKFHISESKKILKKLNKKKPLLFVNGDNDIQWEGAKFILGKDSLSINEIYKILYLCNTYYGKDDEFCEFARIFDKKIILSP